MATLNSRDITKLLTSGLKTEFMKAFNDSPKDHLFVSTPIVSTKDTETYGWLGATPTMKEWKDERAPEGMSEYSFTVPNRDWEASIAVDRNAIEDDQYGQIEMRIRELAQESIRFFDELVFSLILDGDQTSGATSLFYGKDVKCYDGKAFFATNHSEKNSGTISNKGTTALSGTTLKAAITAMRKYKRDNGKPAHINPNLMVIPPDLEWTAKEILDSVYYPEATTNSTKMSNNVLKGVLQLLVEDYLTDANNWYVFDTKKVVKPLILQKRKEPQITDLTTGTEAAFMRKQLYYGIDWRGTAAFGDFRTAYGAIVS